jgi:hypothetical protein
MIAVILNYESRQNPAYRSTLARTFLRDFDLICAQSAALLTGSVKSVLWLPTT